MYELYYANTISCYCTRIKILSVKSKTWFSISSENRKHMFSTRQPGTLYSDFENLCWRFWKHNASLNSVTPRSCQKHVAEFGTRCFQFRLHLSTNSTALVFRTVWFWFSFLYTLNYWFLSCYAQWNYFFTKLKLYFDYRKKTRSVFYKILNAVEFMGT